MIVNVIMMNSLTALQ